MPEGEPGVVVMRVRMTKMGRGELVIADTETAEDGDEHLEMRAVILMGTLQKPGRTRQIRNPRKMMKMRKMRKGRIKLGKAKMRRKRIKSLIRKGKKRRPTRKKKTKRNQDLGN